MKKIKLLVLSLLIMLVPGISLAETGHINGCTNTSFDTNCCTKTFRITPQAGYTVTDVIVNGVSQGPITSYTFSNITGPQTLKVVTTANAGGGTGGTGSGTGTGGTVSGGPYTIRFNANGGTGTMANQTYEAGVEQTLPANTFTKTGYSFGGWALTAGGPKVYTDVDYYTATKNQSLYADWENTSSSGGATANTDCIVLNPDFSEEDLGGDVALKKDGVELALGQHIIPYGTTLQFTKELPTTRYGYVYINGTQVYKSPTKTATLTYNYTVVGDMSYVVESDAIYINTNRCAGLSSNTAATQVKIVNSGTDPLWVVNRPDDSAVDYIWPASNLD